jgi:hypothetical protein
MQDRILDVVAAAVQGRRLPSLKQLGRMDALDFALNLDRRERRAERMRQERKTLAHGWCSAVQDAGIFSCDREGAERVLAEADARRNH